MRLIEFLEKKHIKKIFGDENIDILSVQNDSRKVFLGTAFFAIKGYSKDANEFINQAIDSGAVAIISDKTPEVFKKGVTYVIVDNVRKTLAESCKKFFGNPSSKIKLVAVTGTCGKTSIATLLYELFLKLGYKVGLLSTIHNKINEEIFQTALTTPDVIEINTLLKKMVDEECQYCFMEASSHAIDQDRIFGLDIDIAIFTNLSHEHLDYHKNLLEYSYVKKKLFDGLKRESTALVNFDDKHSNVMIQNCKSKVLKYSLLSLEDFHAKILESTSDGLLLKIENKEVWTKLKGDFNAYNFLAVYATAVILGEDKNKVLINLSSLDPVEGRFQFLKSNSGKTAILDYAHTPESIKCLLKSVEKIKKTQSRIIAITGCGGDRDKSKRPITGKIVSENSNVFILTSDNPRTEDPKKIMEDVYKGVSDNLKINIVKIENRKEAIIAAEKIATENDLIVIMGKGHENYQIVGTEKKYFSDKDIFMNL